MVLLPHFSFLLVFYLIFSSLACVCLLHLLLFTWSVSSLANRFTKRTRYASDWTGPKRSWLSPGCHAPSPRPRENSGCDECDAMAKINAGESDRQSFLKETDERSLLPEGLSIPIHCLPEPWSDRWLIISRWGVVEVATIVLRWYNCCKSSSVQEGRLFIRKQAVILLNFERLQYNGSNLPIKNAFNSVAIH